MCMIFRMYKLIQHRPRYQKSNVEIMAEKIFILQITNHLKTKVHVSHMFRQTSTLVSNVTS